MLVQNVHSRKALWTTRHRARIWLLTGVTPNVHDELHLCAEHLAATRARRPEAPTAVGVTAPNARNVRVKDVFPKGRHVFTGAVRAVRPLARQRPRRDAGRRWARQRTQGQRRRGGGRRRGRLAAIVVQVH